jgi:TRAP-type C4-dicarboxylate transport system permease small subunit
MRAALDALYAVVDHLCRALLVALTVAILWVVFGRYVLNATPRWGEELALALLVWLSLLPVALGVAGRWHIRLDLVADALPPRPRAALARTEAALGLVVAVLMIWFGWRIAELNLGSRLPGLGISAFWQYLAMPVSGVLTAVAVLDRAILRGRGPMAEDAP